jgi:hypothetical protein
VRIFTDEPCCLRLIRALAVETHEEWIDGSRYLNMEPLRELLKKPAPTAKRLKGGEADRLPVHPSTQFTKGREPSPLP